MRARVYSNSGNLPGGFTFRGGDLTGVLLLAGNPTRELEAAPKQYVDALFSNLNTANITSGIFPVSRLPDFAGDVSKPAGSSTVNLISVGITPGNFTRPNIDVRGRVVGGGALTEADIPNMSWNRVSIGRPTTLSGYGITDGVSLAGGILSGFLSFNGAITGTLQAVTKQYIDSGGPSGVSVAVGDIIRRASSVTPAGFLRCNGAWVSTTTFADLYAVIGDTFTNPLVIGSGQPWRQQYDINTSQSGGITGWTTGTSLPGVLSYSSAIVTRNRVFLLGGGNGAIGVSTVFTAPINSDGTLGTWTTSTSLPGVSHASSAIVTRNRVFLLGGWGAGIDAVSTVRTAPINADGTLGVWTTGTSLPGVLMASSAIVTRNRVFLLGGWVTNMITTSVVFTAPINSDGTLGVWTTSTVLPVALGNTQAIVTRNRVFLLGGWISGVGAISTVYTTTINADGTLGAWTTGTSLPGGLTHSQTIVTQNRVFLLGGSETNIVYTAPINSDGTLGVWSTGASLPGVLGVSQAIVTSSRVFLLGGWVSANISTSTVYTAPILGGLNDYSPYYDGSIEALRLTTFALPDLTLSEEAGTISYIKF